MKKQHDQTVSNTDKTDVPSPAGDDWKNKYLRALADYQNLERRVSQHRQELKDQSIEEIMRHVLSFLDEIERAQKHMNDSGLAHAIKGFDKILAHYRIKKIDVLAKQFDPHSMECVEVVSGTTDNEVIEEVRAGYVFGDKVLRPSWVKVSKHTH